jgi:hypothetical protein
VTAAGFPPNCALIEVHVSDLKELFNSLDPTPFLKRDLDPSAEEFILGWAREIDKAVPLGLLVHVDRQSNRPDATETVHTAVRDHFKRRAETTRQNLRRLFRLGRASLAIGLTFLAACVIAADLVEPLLGGLGFARVAQEGLIIGGWVAMWRPIEIFLYEWWPIRAEARLFDRLSAMMVSVVPTDTSSRSAAINA